MLSSDVATGRRMNGAEICILVRPFPNCEPCTGSFPVEGQPILILIGRPECLLKVFSRASRDWPVTVSNPGIIPLTTQGGIGKLARNWGFPWKLGAQALLLWLLFFSS